MTAKTNLMDQISSVLCSSGMDERHARAAATAAAQRIRTGTDRYTTLMKESDEQETEKER